MRAPRILRPLIGCLLLFALGAAGQTPDLRALGRGAVATGRHRNLFAEADHTPAEINARLTAAHRQLFHGDPKSEAVYFAVGGNSNGPLAYVHDVGNGDVRSEGMSYGMMISVQLDQRAEFDALWNWARSFMYHPSPTHPAFGYFSWSMKTNGIPNDEMPAPDGEEYFATALLFASGRWGNGQGIYNYRVEAERILRDLRHRSSITGQTVKGRQTAVAIFHPARKMVRFTPDVDNSEHTDPSYHVPAFYQWWARVGPAEDRGFWAEAAVVSRDFLYRAAHATTGLTPDYANFDGSPWASSWNPRSAEFHVDAWRTVMNWSVDWAWWASDVRQPELSDRLLSFFAAQGITNYGNHFTLAGQRRSTDHSPGLVAMNATAGLAATHPRAREFVEAFWNTPVPTGRYRYYDGMLYLLGWLHCAGEFRVWEPR